MNTRWNQHSEGAEALAAAVRERRIEATKPNQTKGRDMQTTMTPDHEKWGDFYAALSDKVKTHGCGNDRPTLALQVLRETFPTVDAFRSETEWRARGGYCDCEILFNVD